MKVWNYLIIMITMMIFLKFVGIETVSGTLLGKIGLNIDSANPIASTYNISTSDFYNNFLGLILGISIAGAVIVGFFTKTFDWKIALFPFMTGTVLLFVASGINIIQYASSTGSGWLTAIVITIFFPLVAGFVYSVFEWFGGSD